MGTNSEIGIWQKLYDNCDEQKLQSNLIENFAPTNYETKLLWCLIFVRLSGV